MQPPNEWMSKKFGLWTHHYTSRAENELLRPNEDRTWILWRVIKLIQFQSFVPLNEWFISNFPWMIVNVLLSVVMFPPCVTPHSPVTSHTARNSLWKCGSQKEVTLKLSPAPPNRPAAGHVCSQSEPLSANLHSLFTGRDRCAPLGVKIEMMVRWGGKRTVGCGGELSAIQKSCYTRPLVVLARWIDGIARWSCCHSNSLS